MSATNRIALKCPNGTKSRGARHALESTNSGARGNDSDHSRALYSAAARNFAPRGPTHLERRDIIFESRPFATIATSSASSARGSATSGSMCQQ